MDEKSPATLPAAPTEADRSVPSESSHTDDSETGVQQDVNLYLRTLEEEPLGVGSKYGFGHYNVQFGEVVCPEDGSTRYRVERKLGWGLYSSVWLARELQKDRFVALKILTTNATHLHDKAAFIEVDALALLAGHPNIVHPLRDFTISANQSSDAEGEKHIVIALELYNGTLKSILTNSPPPPLPFVKRAMLHVLRGLAHMHSRGFVHTDLKADNILVDCGLLTNADIDGMLAADPPRRCSPKASSSDPLAAVSQPLPVPTVDDAMERTFCISDMGSVRRKEYLKPGMKLCPEDLQAPEVIFGAPLDEKIDIWLFGLLMFEVVIGRPPFQHDVCLDEGTDVAIPFLLWQMSAILSDVDAFPPYLRDGVYAAKYLNADGVLFEPDLPPQVHSSMRITLAKWRPDLDPVDGDAILAIWLRCLQLDPRMRPSAAELLEDPWWRDGDV